ncbi:MAG TPA: DUF58 domain-containing protein [Thermoplasmata archaeon]|nr:DUF58 domain-containing protein [Thermoplasmata archaeon]
MRTPAVTVLAVAAAAFLLVSLISRNPLFALLTLPLFVLLTLGVLLRPAPLRLRVERAISRDRIAVDQEVSVALTIRNLGASVDFLEVEDRLPREAEVLEGTPHLVTRVGSGGSVTVRYRVALRAKGELALGPLVLRSREPLGLHFEEEALPLTATLVVAPKMEDVRRLRVAPRRTRTLLGQTRSRHLGPGSEFWGVREYEPGDELRAINWKASARFGRLFTNEFEGERSADAVIVLDARAEADVGPAGASTVELGVRAAVSLSATILHAQNRVGLIVQRDVIDWVYPGYGKRQLYRIVDHLLHVRSGGEWPLEHVVWVVSRFFPRQCQLILVTPLVDRRALDNVITLAAHGFDLLVVAPSPLEVERAMYREDPYVDASYRVLRLERDNLVADLRRYATVVEWDGVTPLAAALGGVRPYPIRR